jgi:nitroreductase
MSKEEQMDYKTIIPKRKSVRNYKKTEVSTEIRKELKHFYEHERRLIEDIGIEVFVKNKADVYDVLKGLAGYNEFMIEAPHYFIILSDEKEHYIENAGYVGENLLLKAFDLGVGSCWITFKDGDEIKEKLCIDSDRKLAGLIAFGFDDNKNKVLYDNFTEYNPTKANLRVVEDNSTHRLGVEEVVFVNEWGNKAEADELNSMGLLDAFHYARLSPSSKNMQPWRFIADSGVIVLAMQSEENAYEEKVDTGIVMLYFESIVDSTLYDMTWHMGKPDKEYNIPSDYKIVGYCTI